MNLLGKGAEAELIACVFQGEAAVCKRRVRKAYRLYDLDQRIRTQRTKKEARILASAKQAGVRCPRVMGVDLQLKEIFLNRIRGELLRNALARAAAAADGKGAHPNALRALLVCAGEQLALLHGAGLVHGDSTTSNFMVDDAGKVWLIDFGLAEYDSSPEQQATDLLLAKKSLSEKQFEYFLKGYSSENKKASAVLKQLDEIEMRGRYVVRAMTN